MALYTTGITASWRTTTIGEVTELKIVSGGSLPIGRGSTVATQAPYSLDAGTIEVMAFTTSTLSMREYGRKGVLSFTGPDGFSVTTKAVCQTLELTGQVNDVFRNKAVFKIVME